MASSEIPPEKAQAYWRRTSNLMWVTLAIWFVFSFIVPVFARELNTIRIFGFPLGFYMAAQGSLIVFVILIFWYGNKQNKIDDEFGVSEE